MMNKGEVIIEIGAEGGSITLYGFRTERGWLFSRKVIDWTPELIGEEWVKKKSGVVDSWDAALKLLDRYPWPRLVPISVHPDFKQKIWSALQERLHNAHDLERWRKVCDVR